jgi:hypothetical protein
MSNEENQETSPEEYPTPYEYILKSPVEDAQGETITGINLQEPTIAEIE